MRPYRSSEIKILTVCFLSNPLYLSWLMSEGVAANKSIIQTNHFIFHHSYSRISHSLIVIYNSFLFFISWPWHRFISKLPVLIITSAAGQRSCSDLAIRVGSNSRWSLCTKQTRGHSVISHNASGPELFTFFFSWGFIYQKHQKQEHVF